MKFPSIVVHTNYPLDVVDIEDVGNILSEAEEVWRARGGPEMWIFGSVGEAPFRCAPFKQLKGKK